MVSNSVMRLGCFWIFVYLVPAIWTAPVETQHVALEDLEFNHPQILPEHPDNLRKDKAKSRANKDYITKERLPPNLYALNYDLWFKPYFPAPGIQYDSAKNFTFEGRASISVEALINTDRFIINAYNFTIVSYQVIDFDGTQVPINSISQNDNNQQLSLISNPNAIVKGNVYTININYTGIINPYTEGGVYYTSYIDPQGATHFMLATHMEPFSARKVFPGLDEPSYKAQFSIKLEYPSSQVALSNMKETTPTDLGNGWSSITFPETPKMSTYLIAFAVGPYVYSGYVNKHNTTTRAWGWPGTEQYLQFAAVNSGECLYQLGEYTGIKFPLEKADQIGMPEFLAGAMENWGLIIYKYQYIAYNPQTMTTRDMEAAAKVMCHELAHQWFGDLVTTAWWDDLFLNEGFADYFMTFIQKPVYPIQSTYLDTLQVLNELQVGLLADASPQAHPLVYADGPAFDDITYNKGASMLRMLSDLMNPLFFQQGIQQYLASKAYGNAKDIDLFSTLTDVAQQHKLTDWCGNLLNITEFMQPYAYQTNHPLIRITSNQNNLNSFVSFTQEPFGNITSPSQWNYKWAIPVRMESFQDPTLHYIAWVTDDQPCPNNNIKKETVHYELGSVHSATYGRIIYDDVGFDKVLKKIAQNDIADNLKLTLIADEYYYLVREKQNNRPYSYDRVLSLIKTIFGTPTSYKNPSYGVFVQAQIPLEELARTFRDSLDSPLVQRLYKNMFTNVYVNLDWESRGRWDEDTFTEVFLMWAVRYDIGDIENRTLTMFANIKSACINSVNGTAWCNPYSTNVRKAIYCGAAKYAPATSDFFYQMLHAYNKEVIANPYFYQEYMALLEGMSCAQSPVLIKNLLRLFTTSTLNQRTLFGFLKYNLAASDVMSNYLLDNPTILSTINYDAYFDAMSYNWGSYKREVQFSQFPQTLTLTDQQYTSWKSYYDRINNLWIYRSTNGLKVLQWLYDNIVVIGKVPWEKALDGTITPKNYELTIQPYIPGSGKFEYYQNMTFDGEVKIRMNVVKPTSTIILNTHRLFIDPASIELYSDVSGVVNSIDIDVANVRKDYDKGLLYIPTAHNNVLFPNSYTLTFEYTGFIFQNPNEGDAINTYYSGLQNTKGWIFTTDFEGGPGVRSLMPCFDEPTYKATFDVNVVHPTDMISLSNSLEGPKTILKNGWTATQFETTEYMSSYLLAICVGHFSNLAKVSDTNKLIRVWTWNGMEQYGEVALNITSGTLDFMSSYFNYDYPLKKLDVMALPQYTQNAGAMENWGLIIGEYSLFMVDPDYTNTGQIAEVAETTAHEVIHQWFGDLVTMDWWSDIFLNEGFAQYWFANGINYTYPEQEGYAIDYNRFIINQIALQVDCIQGYAKPVISDSPPVFGVEPYYKGSALLNLLSNALTPQVLQTGLVSYLRLYGFDNANPDQLWQSLTNAAHDAKLVDWNGNPLNVSDFMKPYTLETSYPILTLTKQGTGSISASQQSCMYDGATWNIPVSTQTSDGKKFNWFVNANGGNDAIWLRPAASPYRVDNVGSTSFTRVVYDDDSWANILTQLRSNPKVFDTITRAQLLDDAYFFYASGRWSITKFLDLTLYLVAEDTLSPWDVATDVFLSFMSRFKYQVDSIADVRNYVVQLTRNAFSKFGFSSNNIWANDQLAAFVTSTNCRAIGVPCRQIAKSLFDRFIQNCKGSQYGTGKCTGLHPNFRTATFCYGLMQSTDLNDVDVVSDLYDLSAERQGYLEADRSRLLNSLGCIQNQTILYSKIDLVVNSVLPTDLLQSIAVNDQTDGTTLYNYFIANTKKVLLANFDFQVYMNALVLNWSTQAQLDKLSQFTQSNTFSTLTTSQQNVFFAGITRVRQNMNWLNSNKDTIISWIRVNFGTMGSS